MSPRGKIDNLRTPSTEVAREIGAKGGLAKAANERRRKSMRERFQALMDVNRGGVSGADALAMAQFEKALGGDTKAFEVIMAYLGDAPPTGVKLILPKDAGDAASLPGITAAVLSAVARGKLSPSDAAKIATVIGAHVKAVEVGELDARLDKLESKL